MQVTNKNSNINIRAEKDILSFDEFETEGVKLPTISLGYSTQLTFSLTRQGKVIHQVMISEPMERDPRFELLLKDVLKDDMLVINWVVQEWT